MNYLGRIIGGSLRTNYGTLKTHVASGVSCAGLFIDERSKDDMSGGASCAVTHMRSGK